MSDYKGFFHRLHTGTGALDFVGKRKRWYLGFGLLLMTCVLLIALRGFNFSIDFVGGTKIEMPAQGTHGSISVQQAKHSFTEALGHSPDSEQSVGSGSSASIELRATHLNNAQSAQLEDRLYRDLQPLGSNGKPSKEAISESAVSGTWGGDISRQALIALAVFLALVAVFLTWYFERWMAVAAITALLHDILVTAGIYALIGFTVTPATVIGLLTILGFSLYDTHVVFDKVREVTRGLLGLTRRTYPEAANLALNQTLMRSINTSLIALLPMLGLLVVGVTMLGTGKLTDLALVQLIGMMVGTLSSVCLATPLLVDMKMRERPYLQQQQRVLERRRKAGKQQVGSDEVEETDEESTAAQQRAQQAMAAAANVPARPGKAADDQRGRGQPRSRRQDSPGQRTRPTGKSGRPSGKRQR